MTTKLMTKGPGRRYRVATKDEVMEAAAAYIVEGVVKSGEPMTSPRLAAEVFGRVLKDLEYEQFVVAFLDSRHRLIACVPMFRGTVDGASVHPREVVKAALAYNAAAVVLAHNHPSGVSEPSRADETITTRLRDALALVDIRVVDHLVIGRDSTVSLAERGLI